MTTPAPPASTDPLRILGEDIPIVLLPVRLETRFAVQAGSRGELRVRIYPDEIHADTHEPPLTKLEREAGAQYWKNPAEAAAWSAILSSYPAPRAAWIVRQTAPKIPSSPDRPASWTRAAEARLLPDQWIVRAYRGGKVVKEVVSKKARSPLALTVSPGDKTPRAVLPGGMTVDPAIAWTIDFQSAIEAGMAVRFDLDATDMVRGFDLLLVAGVKTTLDAGKSADALRGLLDAHHYARGIAFLAQGTPTNNTGEERSAWPVDDPNGSVSFRVERGAPLVRPDSNGALLAQALGVSQETFQHVAEADLREQAPARAMNQALFAATLGYFLDQMMDPVFSDEEVRRVRAYFVDSVRGRGPLGAFRIGAVPYGTLPAGSLDKSTGRLAESLRKLRNVWRAQIGNAPRAGLTTDGDADLMSVLSMDASCREVFLREAYGPEMQANLLSTLGVAAGAWMTYRSEKGKAALELAGVRGNPRLADVTFADEARPSSLDMVGSLEFNYIRWIRTASLSDLRQQRLPAGVQAPKSLLYGMLRYAALTEYSQAAFALREKSGQVKKEDRKEEELSGLTPGRPVRPKLSSHLDAKIPGLGGGRPLGDFLQQESGADVAELKEFLQALRVLEALPASELEMLFAETLDLCSYRLDAWITSIFTQRLGEIRRRRPLDTFVGAFGWSENPRPAAARGPSGGFIQAPSMSHAAAAAVLRNAYLSHDEADRAGCAIDLSSNRVRCAMLVLDAVRAGQPLGAVLGYQFERGLHEGHPAVELNRFIDDFRKLFPLVTGKLSGSTEPVESSGARNTVDGLALRTAWNSGELRLEKVGLPAKGPDRAAIEEELRLLDDTVDAVADLLASEAVYQSVRGNTSAAAASLDAMSKGTRPPDPEVIRQPRSGTPLTHRLALVFSERPMPNTAWSSIPETPRAHAEPILDAWIGTLLGDPALIPSARQLGLRPIDLLYLCESPEIAIMQDNIELLRSLKAVLSSGRALTAGDMTTPESSSPLSTSPELDARAQSAATALSAACDQLRSAIAAGTAIDAALHRASLFGVSGGIEATQILSELEGRRTAAQSGSAVERLKAIFGREFTVLPLFAPPGAGGLAQLLATSESTSGGRENRRKWLAQAATVRRNVSRWREFGLLSKVLRGSYPDLSIAQIPVELGATWAALPFPNEAVRPKRGKVSLALHAPVAPNPHDQWCGLLIDEWQETIPSRQEQTGIAFQYDDPGAEAAQSILIAVPPAGERWSTTLLFAILEETFELAKIRAVDLDLLDPLGQLLPALYVPFDTAGEIPSPDLE